MTTRALRPLEAAADPADRTAFRVNGGDVVVEGSGGRRLLDVLRLDLGLTGTKEGCGEGECGACAVLVDGALANSCLVPVGQVDGRSVVTVEGLAVDGRLDPLQAAFLEAGGTQCGMCAPGMLLAAHALLDGGGIPGEPAIRRALAGTLCRCTGYAKPIEAVLAAAAGSPAAPDARTGASRRPAGRVTLAPDEDPDAPRLVRAASLAEALELLARDPSLIPVAGATDLYAAPTRPLDPAGRPRTLLDLSGLEALQGIRLVDDTLELGALVTWAAALDSAAVAASLPVLAAAAGEMGGPAIRARASLGGSCVTASPAGDLAPILLATDAVLVVRDRATTREIPAVDFWTGYRRTALRPGELLVAIRVPVGGDRRAAFRKVGTRRALSIAKASLALGWRVDGMDGRWRDVRLALGSVADRPIRATRTEARLEGRVPGPALAAEAAAVVAEEISPIDDIRSTAAYRRSVTARVLRRLVEDHA